MRATKTAIADALRDDPAVSALVPVRASLRVSNAPTVPVPAIRSKLIGGHQRKRVGDGPMVQA